MFRGFHFTDLLKLYVFCQGKQKLNILNIKMEIYIKNKNKVVPKMQIFIAI